jgi:HSP20 family protein
MPRNLPVWSPFKPFRELDQFRRSFDEMFDRLLGSWTPGEAMRGMIGMGTEPPIESFVENGKVVIRVDLPGVEPKDVEVTVSGDTLTIRGKRERTHEEQGRDYLHREVSYGSFERSITLPAGIDPDQIKAAYKDGVLELTAPAPKELSPRKVPVMTQGEKHKNG